MHVGILRNSIVELYVSKAEHLQVNVDLSLFGATELTGSVDTREQASADVEWTSISAKVRKLHSSITSRLPLFCVQCGLNHNVRQFVYQAELSFSYLTLESFNETLRTPLHGI